METIYWLVTIGKLNTLFSVMMSISLVLCLMAFVNMAVNWDMGDETPKYTKKWLKYSMISSIIFIVLSIFTPNKTDMLAIYGVGNAIEYLNNNENANKIPDNAVNALNKWLEDYVKGDKK